MSIVFLYSIIFEGMLNQDTLSKRESQVLDLLVTGMNNQQIASKLGVSVNTIKTQLKQVYRKLQISSRYEAMSMHLQNTNHST